jgi:hypothetical protein
MDIKQLLRAAVAEADDSSPPPHGECMAILSEFGRRYGTPCPFSVGDWVTARRFGRYSGHGAPCLVVEVIDRRSPEWRSKGCDVCNGDRVDMRIARVTHRDNLGTFWVESEHYEPYNSN